MAYNAPPAGHAQLQEYGEDFAGEDFAGFDAQYYGEAPDAAFYGQYDVPATAPAAAAASVVSSSGWGSTVAALAPALARAGAGAGDADAPPGAEGDATAYAPGAAEEDDGVRIVVDDAGEEEGGGVAVDAGGGGGPVTSLYGKAASYHRVRRSGVPYGGKAGYTARPRAPTKSVFEELGEPIPDETALPNAEHITLFEVPLDAFKSRPWELPTVDAADYFNYGLRADSWSRYAKTQARVREELGRVEAARRAAEEAGMALRASAPPAAPAPAPPPAAPLVLAPVQPPLVSSRASRPAAAAPITLAPAPPVLASTRGGGAGAGVGASASGGGPIGRPPPPASREPPRQVPPPAGPQGHPLPPPPYGAYGYGAPPPGRRARSRSRSRERERDRGRRR
jgi:hypothetical protein